MDIARRLLETTQDELRELAPQRGFTHATRLKLAFRRELGIASAVYRQRTQQASRGIDDGRELRRNGNRYGGLAKKSVIAFIAKHADREKLVAHRGRSRAPELDKKRAGSLNRIPL